MFCLKAECCMNCEERKNWKKGWNSCGVHCGYRNKVLYESVGIDDDKEFSEVFCDKCSFRVFKKEN